MAEKVTLKDFTNRLAEYDSAGGARKAVGRFNGWSEEEKNKARKLINNYFGETDAEVKAKPTKEGAKRLGRPPKAGKKAVAAKVPGRRPGRPPKVRTEAPPTEVRLQTVEPLSAKARTDAQYALGHVLSGLSTIVANAKIMHDVSPALKLQPLLSSLVDAHNAALGLVAQELPVTCTPDTVSAASPKRGRGRAPAAAAREGDNGRALDLSQVEEDDDEFAPQLSSPTQI